MKPGSLKSAFYLLLLIPFSACAFLDSRQTTESAPESASSCDQNCAFTFSDGGAYRGQLSEGQPNGHGRVLWANGTYYDGDFLNGKMHGSGNFVSANGDHYVGSFSEDQLEGLGIFSFSNGTRYSGEFIKSEFNGNGILIRFNGDKYVGGFKDNQFHGKGMLYFTDPQGRHQVLGGAWNQGQYDENQEERGDESASGPLSAEVVLFYQYKMLTDMMEHIEASRPGITDLYLVSFGGDGSQDVFMKEVFYLKSLFEKQYGMENRTIELINNASIVHKNPIASMINLKVALEIIAQQMDVKEDILFLYLTSHGSRDHRLSVRLGGVPLGNLSAETLAEILKESGIQWKVIVISACYSGGFIEHLKDDSSMIITSARADRSSFGCSDDAELTYFGRAFLQHALDQSTSFADAFVLAKEIVSGWEEKDHFTPSEPQIYTGPLIEKKLKSWRQTLDQQVAVGITYNTPY